MTTIDDNAPNEPSPGAPRLSSTTGLSVRQLVAELARAEDALRSRPDDPEPAQQMRLLVRELRRRRARLRVQSRQLLSQTPREGRR